MADPSDDLEDDVVVPLAPAYYAEPEAEELLLRVRRVIEAAPKMPLSASSMIAKEEVLALLDDAIDALPEELRAARWLLKDREEFLARVAHEGDEIVGQARARAEHMVQRTEIVKAAEQRAYEILDRAENEARRLRHEVEDYCDQKLASFEIVLERTLNMVSAGRAKLQGTNLTAGIPVDEPPPGEEDDGDDAWGRDGAADVDDRYDDRWVEQLSGDDVEDGEQATAHDDVEVHDDHADLPPLPSGGAGGGYA